MLIFRKIDIETIDDFKVLEVWDNSDDSYLFRPNFEEKNSLPRVRAIELWRSYEAAKKVAFMIELDGSRVGKVGYTLDFPHLHIKAKKTAWLDIVIGDKSARGKGIGKKALEFIEKEVKKAGLERIELGVFEFNHKAYNLYKSCGYSEIARIERITYYDNKWRSDIRMEKVL